MASARTYSWGNLPRVEQRVVPIHWRDQTLPDSTQSLLGWGMGRSYGDSCVNDGQTVLSTRSLDRLIAFDRSSGRLHCEAGVTLGEVLALVVPAGWFLPVTPGTKHVTLGGAVANDVHGKNHHRVGSFGHHVSRLELVRSDLGRVFCSPTERPELFNATVGGLGLTGLIMSVEIELRPVASELLDTETIRFSNLEEFRQLSQESADRCEYVYAWLDCASGRAHLGRGLLTRADHAPSDQSRSPRGPARTRLSVPFMLPSFALSAPAIRCFNACVYHRQRRKSATARVHYDPFLYPLDSIRAWNRIYGSRGFYQYQCVVPKDAYDALRALLAAIDGAGGGSFLAVLKEFGPARSVGMLSFPREGITLALDFPNRGGATLELLDRLDDVVMDAGGAVYAAKDARMSSRAFAAYYPQWREFERLIDPRFSSTFWRRVTRGLDSHA